MRWKTVQLPIAFIKYKQSINKNFLERINGDWLYESAHMRMEAEECYNLCQCRADREAKVSVVRCPGGRMHKRPTWERKTNFNARSTLLLRELQCYCEECVSALLLLPLLCFPSAPLGTTWLHIAEYNSGVQPHMSNEISRMLFAYFWCRCVLLY